MKARSLLVNYIGAVLLFFVSSCVYSNGDISVFPPEKCERLKTYLQGFIHDNVLIRNELTSSVPYVRTSFKDDGRWVRVPLRIVDLDNNGSNELIYLIDIASPQHVETKIYNLKNLTKIEAESISSKKNKSPYYRPFMMYLQERYDWNYLKDIQGGNPQLLSVNENSSLRKSLFNFDGTNYMLIEQIDLMHIWIATFLKSQNYKSEVICDLGIYKKW